MIPIHELLSRIRWDPAFADAEFTIGYYDRVRDTIVHVPLRALDFPNGSPGVFELTDTDGQVHTIPLHRIKAVYRDRQRIWHREH